MFKPELNDAKEVKWVNGSLICLISFLDAT